MINTRPFQERLLAIIEQAGTYYGNPGLEALVREIEVGTQEVAPLVSESKPPLSEMMVRRIHYFKALPKGSSVIAVPLETLEAWTDRVQGMEADRSALLWEVETARELRDAMSKRVERIIAVITPSVIVDGKRMTYKGPDIAERFAILSDAVIAALPTPPEP